MNYVIIIDCNYIAPEVAASYLVVRNGRAAFIENNTARAVPLLLQALKGQGLKPSDVEYVIVTHAHLDHSAGSSALMDACPRAELLCHPQAARHLIDPARLVESTSRVYGATRFSELYGAVGPVSAHRVRGVHDGETVNWHGAALEFHHTPGHASHHLVVVDRGSSSVFTGDAFGVCYPLLQRRGQLVLPSSPPTDFDAKLSIAGAQRIAGIECRHLYPTHFGLMPGTQQEALTELRAGFLLFHEFVDRCTAELQRGVGVEQVEQECRAMMDSYVLNRLHQRGLKLTAAQWSLLSLDRELNAMGLAVAAQRRLRKQARR